MAVSSPALVEKVEDVTDTSNHSRSSSKKSNHSIHSVHNGNVAKCSIYNSMITCIYICLNLSTFAFYSICIKFLYPRSYSPFVFLLVESLARHLFVVLISRSYNKESGMWLYSLNNSWYTIWSLCSAWSVSHFLIVSAEGLNMDRNGKYMGLFKYT